MNHPPILLVGAGLMAQAYAKTLRALKVTFIVFGRGHASAEKFAAETGVRPATGHLDVLIEQQAALPQTAIVTVNAENLHEVTQQLMTAGCKRILVEKPAGLSAAEVNELSLKAQSLGVEIYVAYNRRFYASVARARTMIQADGGAVSLKFDFTEASRRIETLDKPQKELEAWFFGNSTHVVDLAFYLAGEPAEMTSIRSGSLSWHKEGAVFAGHGTTSLGALFSYHANWLSPGRWGVEVMTRERRYVLQPMEQLFVQDHNSFALSQVDLDDQLDKEFKPGLYKQVETFLSAAPNQPLLSIHDHARLFTAYQAIRDGKSYRV